MNNFDRKKAFSLIELSIVILIIGIIIAGVTQGSRVVTEMKLATAKAQTQSSPVASISGLAIWLDATSDKSFTSATTSDGTSISTWYDLNPQGGNLNNATNSGSNSTKPTYSKPCINGLPCVKFTGTSDSVGQYMDTTNDLSYISDMTQFVVFSLTSFPGTGYEYGLITTLGSWANGVTYYKIRQSTSAIESITCPNGYRSSATISTNTSYVATLLDQYSTTGSLYHYINGTQSGSTGAASAKVLGILSIGDTNQGTRSQFFNGNIGEIIIFDRALKTEERKAVEKYLGKKWGISVS